MQAITPGFYMVWLTEVRPPCPLPTEQHSISANPFVILVSTKQHYPERSAGKDNY